MRSNSANVRVDGFVLLSGHIHTHHVAGIDVVNGKVTWKGKYLSLLLQASIPLSTLLWSSIIWARGLSRQKP